MTNTTKTDKELDIKQSKIDKAVRQGQELQNKVAELKAFKELTKNEQNRILMTEFRVNNPVKNGDVEKRVVDIKLNSKCFVTDKEDTATIFEGTYIAERKNAKTTVHITGKGFLRLIKGETLEIKVTKNKKLTKAELAK